MESYGDVPRRSAGPTVVSVVSPARDSGRTSALANLAWLLASAGHRVVIVDADAGSGRVQEYLQHATAEITTVRTTRPNGDGDSDGAPAASGIDRAEAERRFLLPAGLGHVDLVVCTPQQLAGTVATERQSHVYDVVLVDHPIGSAEDTLQGADCVVVCFQPLREQIVRALTVRRALQAGREQAPRVVLVASQVEPGTEDTQRRTVLSFLTGDASAGGSGEEGPDAAEAETAVVAIPYRAFKADGAIAALIDAPDAAGGVFRAQLELAAAVLPGGPQPRSVPELVRRRYRAALGLQPRNIELVGIVYLGRDRPWADWVGGELSTRGVDHVLLPVTSPITDACTQVVAVVGDPGHEVLDALERRPGLPPGQVLSLLVAPGAKRVPGSLAVRPTPGGHAAASTQLQAGLGWVPALPSVGSAAKYPGGGRFRTERQPLRNVDFVGRDRELDALRDLLPIGQQARVVVHGPAGSGKSELGCEFTHRFADSYEVIWWVQAHSRAVAARGLADLAHRLGVQVGGDLLSDLWEALRNPPRRWLIVLDNAEDPEAVDGLLPPGTGPGTGHVLVTCREPRGPRSLEVGPFDRRHTRDLLTKWMPEFPAEAAERIGELTGDLPIAVRLAVAWLKETVETTEAQGLAHFQAIDWAQRSYTQGIEEALQESVDPTEAPERRLARVALDLTLRSLRGPGDATAARMTAVRLAQLCAFLSPDGLSLALLSSPAMLRELADYPGASAEWIAGDGLLLHYALRVGNRHGLFELNRAGRNEVRMHRIIGDLLREFMSEEEREAHRSRVLGVLAAFAPTDAEGDTASQARNLQELATHLAPSGALDSDDPQVRRWLVLQVRYAYTQGDVASWRAIRAFALELLDSWRERFVGTDPLSLRLAVQLANLERALGRADAARLLDEEALEGQRRTLGLEHPRTLLTARGLAGDYRGLGHFHEALVEDTATYPGLVRTLGRDHLDTLRAASNLALSRYLDGDPVQAAELSGQTLGQLRRLFPPGSSHIARAVLNHALFLRELGEYQAAQDALDSVRTRVRDPHAESYSLDDLRLDAGYALCWRGRGHPAKAKDEHEKVQEALLRRVGPDHPYTVAASVALAADLHALGAAPRAVDLLEEALTNLRAQLTVDHPFVELCRSNLAVHLRVGGDLDGAVQTGRLAYQGLRAALLERHPWTLAAGLNLVGHLGLVGLGGEADVLLQQLAEWSQAHLSRRHPVARTIDRSLARAGTPAVPEVLFEVPPT